MCGIYGVLSYKNKLKNVNALVNTLGMESAERGMDATGVAYVQGGKIKITKRRSVLINSSRMCRSLYLRL